MANVKLTKNELKKQKDQLRQFQRYLPTLQLKKQQLQMVIRQIMQEVTHYRNEQKQIIEALQKWVAVFNENKLFPGVKNLAELVHVEKVERARGNIAGVPIPVFKHLVFKNSPYDLLEYPMWVDQGIDMLRTIARFDAIITTLITQIELLERELRVTSQRVNLFEKVKIPQTKEHIRMIGIYLGDQQTAAVVRGKIAKRKLISLVAEVL
ncbi:MAG: V-type ATP synthase subunit D [Sphaerochaetaceae bacterium]|jgi:V/A-type H+-transporting ATPase subunit D|nr:V-type ATP synthase subunit D [Sphaerochaetaceae bacterium]NLO61121.1 V-type ATP synthase subunit D [Spirochaetales bacterium]MDD2405655.1 V-type ATP synthase subunit D [Sphaerochaetaceae bacterium]MDD3669904.1 V-type ATP synthase subunit D [Sphaerochaetaceae bacterium]MDD4259758.1 V-type ATP synthase subunit D [Sphaerochaetaceae bacterium]